MKLSSEYYVEGSTMYSVFEDDNNYKYILNTDADFYIVIDESEVLSESEARKKHPEFFL